MATRAARTSHHPDDLFDASKYGIEGDGLLIEVEATAVVP